MSNFKRAQEARGGGQEQDGESSPAVRELAESFRRRLGTLDPQQVAIWREMTPARKL